MKSNFISYIIYVFRIDPSTSCFFLIDIIFVFVGLPNIYNYWVQLTDTPIKLVTILALLKALISIFKILYSIYKFYSESKDAKIKSNDLLINGNIKISSKEASFGYEIRLLKNNNLDNYIITSENINNCLLNNEFREIVISINGHKQIFDKIKYQKNILLPFLKYQVIHSCLEGKNFFNEKKLCLSEDILKPHIPITCHKGTYYDSFLTNEIYGKYLISNLDSNIILADARNYAPFNQNGNSYVLHDISSSNLNNHIGVSTIAITKDNYIVIWKQRNKNMIGEHQFVSTGSGSCDYKDLVSLKDEPNKYSFPETIKKSMERELIEENNLPSNTQIKETIILGYFRSISRGGKPEFAGLTLLNSNLIDLFPNIDEIYEKKHWYFKNENEIPDVVDEILNSSLPLFISLHFNLLQVKSYYKNKDNIKVS